MVIVLRTIKYFLVAISFVLSTQLYSTHIVGGELYYDHLWPGAYRITLKLYIDCSTWHVDTSSTAMVNVWKGDMSDLLTQVEMGVPVVTNVPSSVNNPCMQSPVGVCVQEAVYTKTVALPSSASGHVLRFESCCRNNNSLNLIAPLTQGVAYFAFIPCVDTVGYNSSPHFNSYPTLYVCQGQQIAFNHAATDPDGDSLAYSLCPAYRVSSTITAVNPVDYAPPYTYAYPMSSNPHVGINPQNGFLYGIPNLLGQWVMCIAVKEYRNHKLLSTHFRDYQYNVINCNAGVQSGFSFPTAKCNGFTIPFHNASHSNFGMNYSWNFGILNSANDTSTQKDPVFTYGLQDTGKHIVRLVVNPGLPCADSMKKTIYIYPKFDVQFHIPPGIQCIKSNTINFIVALVNNWP